MKVIALQIAALLIAGIAAAHVTQDASGMVHVDTVKEDAGFYAKQVDGYSVELIYAQPKFEAITPVVNTTIGESRPAGFWITFPAAGPYKWIITLKFLDGNTLKINTYKRKDMKEIIRLIKRGDDR